MTTREYNEYCARLKKLLAERERLEAKDDFEHEDRLVQIQDEVHILTIAVRAYRTERAAR